jgi:hypothetical protein
LNTSQDAPSQWFLIVLDVAIKLAGASVKFLFAATASSGAQD